MVGRQLLNPSNLKSKTSGQTYSGVEHATGHTVEDPNVHGQRTSETSRDVHEAERDERPVWEAGVIGVDGRLGTDEGQQKEHESAAELAQDDG